MTYYKKLLVTPYSPVTASHNSTALFALKGSDTGSHGTYNFFKKQIPDMIMPESLFFRNYSLSSPVPDYI